MSKAIKVSDQVYNSLQALQEPRESYSEVIGRLLRVYATVKDISDTLGPSHYLKGPRPNKGGDQ